MKIFIAYQCIGGNSSTIVVILVLVSDCAVTFSIYYTGRVKACGIGLYCTKCWEIKCILIY